MERGFAKVCLDLNLLVVGWKMGCVITKMRGYGVEGLRVWLVWSLLRSSCAWNGAVIKMLIINFIHNLVR